MKGVPWTLIVVVLGGFFCALLFGYQWRSYQYDSMMVSINEAMRVATINNVDKSNRVDEKQYSLTEKESFERKFKEVFTENTPINDFKAATFEFEYLPAGDWEQIEQLKGIRAKVKVANKEYTKTYIADITPADLTKN